MKNLRKKLLQKELSTDEKFPCNKVAKDCGHLTKEIGLLQSQALQATRWLDRVISLSNFIQLGEGAGDTRKKKPKQFALFYSLLENKKSWSQVCEKVGMDKFSENNFYYSENQYPSTVISQQARPE